MQPALQRGGWPVTEGPLSAASRVLTHCHFAAFSSGVTQCPPAPALPLPLQAPWDRPLQSGEAVSGRGWRRSRWCTSWGRTTPRTRGAGSWG